MDIKQMLLTPKQFLIIGGPVLILVGVLGFVGVIGPTVDKSIFGSTWWFDNGENWAHVVLGVVGLAAAFLLPANLQRPLVMVLGVVGVLTGIYSVFMPKLLGANLENPTDTILHIAVGAWALLASIPKWAAMPATSGRKAAT
jgi:hypothetical protein